MRRRVSHSLTRRGLILGAACAPLIIPRRGIASPWSPPTYRGQIKGQGIPQINWSHPLAQGLLFYGYDLGYGIDPTGPNPYLELVNLRPVVHIGGAATAGQVTPWGMASLFNNAQSVCFASDAPTRNAYVSGNWTFACGGVRTGTVGSNSTPFGRTANNGGTPFTNWTFYWDFAAGGQDVVGATGDGWSITGTGSTAGINTFGSLACTFTAPSSGTAALFVNGAQKATAASQTLANFTTADDIIFGGNSAVGTSSNFIGYVPYGGFWGRILTPGEIQKLHFDPYCFLTYPEDL